MKNKIYIAILVLLSLGIVLILGFYYTQDFREEFNFDKTINFADIETQTKQSDTMLYLNEATAKLGTLKLTNNGYFTQLYSVPELMGCIVFKESTNRVLPFSISLDSTYSPSSKDGQIPIKVGEEREYTLTGKYRTQYGTVEPMTSFTRENIEAIKIYKLPDKNTNPLSGNRRSSYTWEDTSCAYKTNNEIALATISVN